MIRVTDYLSIFLVFLLAMISFFLSYNALYGVAVSNGLPGKLAYLWPLLVDFSLIVFSIAVLRASLLRERTLWPWLMVGLFSLTTIVFNILHAPANLTAQVVAIVAPVSLFLSFETLMSMLKSGVRKNGVVQSIAQIEAEMKEKAGELDRLKRERLAEIETTTQERQTELDALLVTRQNELDKANRELETVKRQIAQAQTELAETLGQVEGQKDNHIPVVIIGEGLDLPKMKPAERQKYLPQLLNGGVNKDIILDIFGISAKTLDRDIKECNGLIKSLDDVAAESGYGRNGKHRKVGE